MGRVIVLILSGHSLFAEGVASRLKQFPEQVEVKVLAPQHPHVLKRISALNPTVVIMDPTDNQTNQLCPLSSLLQAFPDLKVIQLNPEQEYIQVVTSKKHLAAGVSELIKVIQ